MKTGWLRAGYLGMMLAGLLHGYGQWMTTHGGAHAAALRAALQPFQSGSGWFAHDAFAVLEAWGVYMGIALIALGVQGLLLLPRTAPGAKRSALFGLLISLVFAVIALVLRVQPPAIVFSVLALLFAVAWWQAMRLARGTVTDSYR